MSKARLVITAVVVEKRQVSEVARSYGVSRSWAHALLARYREEGEAPFEPRSRRPRTSPNAISAEVVDLIVAVRKEPPGRAWTPARTRSPGTRGTATRSACAFVTAMWNPPAVSELLAALAYHLPLWTYLCLFYLLSLPLLF